MNKIRFEKFEMKYGYFLPFEYKELIYRFGGDSQFGSCRFDYIDNIVNNTIRIPGDMDFHILPFGDVGNGDYFCFYRFGQKVDDYYVGIWLHETSNFVILASSFKSFMFKCLLDDYLSTVIPNDELTEGERKDAEKESLDRCEILSKLYNFDLNKVKNMRSEFDYHRLMVEYDEGALQSLCYMGKYLLRKRDVRGFDFLEKTIEKSSFYTAPYYIMGRTMVGIGRSGEDYFKRALKTSLVCTGYSYWQEDYLEIPEDVHREIVLYTDKFLKSSEDLLEKSLYFGKDPYDYSFRLDLARRYDEEGKLNEAVQEYSNALFCADTSNECKEILNEALNLVKGEDFNYLRGIIEHDIKLMR